MENKPLTDALDRVRRAAAAQHFSDLSDAALLSRFVSEHDGSAFTALVERHGALVYGVCARILRAPHESEDACQVTFLVLARKAAGIRKQSSLASWLHGVARRVSVTLRREGHRRRIREQQRPVPEAAPADTDLTWSEAQVMLDEELERLPERFRSALILCYLEGKTRDEAAAALGLTPGRLHGLLQRGRDLLRERLIKRGIGLGAGLLGAGLSGGACRALPPALAVRIVNGAVALREGRALAPHIVSARVFSLTAEVMRAMGHTKLKWAAGLGLLCALIGGGAIASGLAPPDHKPPRAVEPVRASAPVPKAPPAEPKVGLRQSTLRATNVSSIAFSPDGGTIASGHWRVTLWDAASGQERISFSGHSAGCSGHVAFHPKGQMLAVTCLGAPGPSEDLYAIHIHDLSKRTVGASEEKAALRLKGHTSYVQMVAYSPDGRVLASAGDKTAKLWDAATGAERRALKHPDWVQAVVFRPDGKVLATTCDDEKLRLWDAETGAELATLKGVHEAIPAFGPDGKSIATLSGDKTAVLWDVPNEKGAEFRERVRFRGHTAEIKSVAISPDGKLLATGSADRTVRLWDTTTGKERAVLKRHQDDVKALAFSPDGRTLASGSSDATIQLWDVSRELDRAARGSKAVPAPTAARLIDVPLTGNCYTALRSQVIASQAEYEALTERVEKTTPREDDRAALLKALAGAKIDFERESLVLIRYTERSPDVRVTVAPVAADGDALVCVIRREGAPGADGEDRPEVVYCFALAVEKGKVKNVDVLVDTKDD